MLALETSRIINSSLSPGIYFEPKKDISSKYIVELSSDMNISQSYFDVNIKVINIENGNVIYHRNITISRTPSLLGPFIDGDKVYFQTENTVYMFDIKSEILEPILKFQENGGYKIIGTYNYNVYYVGYDIRIRKCDINGNNEEIFRQSYATQETIILKSSIGLIYTRKKQYDGGLVLLLLDSDEAILEINQQVVYLNIIGDTHIIYSDNDNHTRMFDIDSNSIVKVDFLNNQGEPADVYGIIGSYISCVGIHLWTKVHSEEDKSNMSEIYYREYVIYSQRGLKRCRSQY